VKLSKKPRSACLGGPSTYEYCAAYCDRFEALRTAYYLMQPEQLHPDATRIRAPHFVSGSQTPVTPSEEIALEIHHAVIPGELAWYAIEGAPGAVEMQLDCQDVQQLRYGDALALLLQTIRELKQAGARLIVAEYPDSEELVTYARLLREAGFEIEATVSDAIADGVGLHFAVKRLVQPRHAETRVNDSSDFLSQRLTEQIRQIDG
jgi:ABC-type transporter Mla MlaB component